MTEITKSSDEKFCFECGAIIRARAEICPKCGVRQPGFELTRYQDYEPEKNRIAAGVLALVLGGLGVHKFYLGKVGMGVLYLIFCWTLIPTVVGFIEGITYLTMSDARFEDKYLID